MTWKIKLSKLFLGHPEGVGGMRKKNNEGIFRNVRLRGIDVSIFDQCYLAVCTLGDNFLLLCYLQVGDQNRKE